MRNHEPCAKALGNKYINIYTWNLKFAQLVTVLASLAIIASEASLMYELAGAILWYIYIYIYIYFVSMGRP